MNKDYRLHEDAALLFKEVGDMKSYNTSYSLFYLALGHRAKNMQTRRNYYKKSADYLRKTGDRKLDYLALIFLNLRKALNKKRTSLAVINLKAAADYALKYGDKKYSNDLMKNYYDAQGIVYAEKGLKIKSNRLKIKYLSLAINCLEKSGNLEILKTVKPFYYAFKGMAASSDSNALPFFKKALKASQDWGENKKQIIQLKSVVHLSRAKLPKNKLRKKDLTLAENYAQEINDTLLLKQINVEKNKLNKN